jgi:hypothetical protein
VLAPPQGLTPTRRKSALTSLDPLPASGRRGPAEYQEPIAAASRS